MAQDVKRSIKMLRIKQENPNLSHRGAGKLWIEINNIPIPPRKVTAPYTYCTRMIKLNRIVDVPKHWDKTGEAY